MGIGGLVGGFVALVLAQRGRLALDFGVGVLLWSAPLLAIAAWPTVGVAAGAMVLIGLGNSLVDINAYTILQRTVPDAVMGRVFGAMESAVIGAMAGGALLMPLLIETVGIRVALAVLGGAVTGIVLLALAGLRRIDLTALAPPGLELVRRISIFTALPEPILERLARALDTGRGRSRAMSLIHEGDEGDRFYAIEEGTVVVSKEGRWVAEPRARRLLRRDRAAQGRAADGDRDGEDRREALRARARRLHPGRHRPPRRPGACGDGDGDAARDALANGPELGDDLAAAGHRRRYVADVRALGLDREAEERSAGAVVGDRRRFRAHEAFDEHGRIADLPGQLRVERFRRVDLAVGDGERERSRSLSRSLSACRAASRP